MVLFCLLVKNEQIYSLFRFVVAFFFIIIVVDGTRVRTRLYACVNVFVFSYCIFRGWLMRNYWLLHYMRYTWVGYILRASHRHSSTRPLISCLLGFLFRFPHRFSVPNVFQAVYVSVDKQLAHHKCCCQKASPKYASAKSLFVCTQRSNSKKYMYKLIDAVQK